MNTWQGNPVKEAFTGRELSFEEVVEDINKSVSQHTKNKEKVIMTAFIKACHVMCLDPCEGMPLVGPAFLALFLVSASKGSFFDPTFHTS